jgi:hypothetical protein
MITLDKDLPTCRTTIQVRTAVEQAARLREGWSLLPVPEPSSLGTPAEAIPEPVAPTPEPDAVEDAPKKRGRPRKVAE